MACTDYDNIIHALDASTMAVRDAVLCPYQTSLGGTFFATVVILGMVNLPIYNRTDSVIVPFVLTLLISGVVLAQATAMAQGIIQAGVLFVLGVGPVIVLRRIRR